MIEIDILKWQTDIVNLWMNRWFVLTSGTIDDCNMMTVSWGSIGCIWNKPFAQILVRPQRYTYNYTEKYDTFTLCAFPEEYRESLQTLGTISGRRGDKLSMTDLTLKKSAKIAAPGYNEASLILECKKVYTQDLDPKGFLDKTIQKNYPINDYHRLYFGEILAAFKSDQ